jgi:response regulator RpfG family c-di-GMP phosphodiesterase
MRQDKLEMQATQNVIALQADRRSPARMPWRRMVDWFQRVSAASDQGVEAIERLLLAAESRDNETGGHVARMGRYAALLGRALDLSEHDQRMLLLAAPMHDIGKVSTPDAILFKPGRLTRDEWSIMKQHPLSGHRILTGSSSEVLQVAAQIALRHHERWDGTGYPDGLRGTEIPLSARICSVSDVFDALISDRPYKPAWDIDAAFFELDANAGTFFDPQLVARFLSMRLQVEAIADRFSRAERA